MYDDTERADYTTKLFNLASPLFLYLVSFRRKVRKGYPVHIEMVDQDLQAIFENIDREIRNDLRLETLYNDAKYPLVVLTDEVLLHSDWENASTWQQQYLLEMRLFQTNIGGDEIFRVASELKDNQVELAAILFTALSLGNYYSKRELLPDVKSKLYRQLQEYLVSVKPDRLTPSAYKVIPKKAERFSPAITGARVAILAFGLVGLYWGAARLSWNHLLADLRQLVEQILGQV